ncbi:hypothetical protein BST81_20425 [Leptolyngbya sp. 'hensonii']|uniref:tetratricopeptide repeat protein n=1 Tax=Leptolyngbya sp. 'hensonii' TaxID=1922337 RepID=UPI00094F91F3|nr:tetratricopeptide repeat protein [Leptolyngbya sp. 'hensonii']OLP16566.1 hypothetical protein BST81_20425 [Leptolyngbya sp. 'hensonii']
MSLFHNFRFSGTGVALTLTSLMILMPGLQGLGVAQMPPSATSPDKLDRSHPSKPRFSYFNICTPEDSLLANLAAALANIGQYDRALQLTTEIQDATPKSMVQVYLVAELAQAQNFDLALTVAQALRDMNDSGPPPFSLSPLGENFQQQALAVISFELAAAGQPEKALSLAEKITDKTMRPILLFSLAAQLESQGNLRQAEPLYSEAKRLLKQYQGNFQVVMLLESTTDGLIKRGQIEPALKIAQFIEELQQTSRDRVAYGNNQIALQVVTKLVEMGQYDRALQLTQQMSGKGFGREYLLIKLVTESSRNGQIEFALQTSRLLQDKLWRAMAVRNITVALAEQQEYDRALEVAETIPFLDTQVYAQTAVAYRLWKRGQPDRALKLAEQIPEPEFRAVMLNSLAVAALETGQPEKADSLLRQVLKLLDSPEIPPKSYEKPQVQRELALNWAKLGQYGQALKVTQMIRQPNVKDRVLGLVALEMVAAKRYDQGLQVARTIREQRMETEALIQITTLLLKAGEYDRALKLINGFPDNLRINDPDEFTNITRIVTGPELKSTLLGVTAVMLQQQGQADQALQVAEQIPDSFTKAMILGAMAVTAIEAPQGSEQMAALLSKARQVARSSQRPPSKKGAPPPFACLSP